MILKVLKWCTRTLFGVVLSADESPKLCPLITINKDFDKLSNISMRTNLVSNTYNYMFRCMFSKPYRKVQKAERWKRSRILRIFLFCSWLLSKETILRAINMFFVTHWCFLLLFFQLIYYRTQWEWQNTAKSPWNGHG